VLISIVKKYFYEAFPLGLRVLFLCPFFVNKAITYISNDMLNTPEVIKARKPIYM